MEAMLLGTSAGKADHLRFGPANLLWAGGEPLLVDCGNGALPRMRAAGVYPGDVKRVFLTHLHYDHYVDLPYLLIEPLIGEAAFDRGKVEVYGPPGTARLLRDLERAYDVELDSYAGMKGYERVRDLAKAEVREVFDGWEASVAGVRVTAGQVDHGVVSLPAFAYRFDGADGRSIAFSGDTVPCDGMVALAEGVDVLVHESTLPDSELQLRRANGFAWYIHSTPRGAGQVARDARAGRLVLNHFAIWNSFSPEREVYDWDAIAPPEAGKEYPGEVIVGHDLMRITV